MFCVYGKTSAGCEICAIASRRLEELMCLVQDVIDGLWDLCIFKFKVWKIRLWPKVQYIYRLIAIDILKNKALLPDYCILTGARTLTHIQHVPLVLERAHSERNGNLSFYLLCFVPLLAWVFSKASICFCVCVWKIHKIFLYFVFYTFLLHTTQETSGKHCRKPMKNLLYCAFYCPIIYQHICVATLSLPLPPLWFLRFKWKVRATVNANAQSK